VTATLGSRGAVLVTPQCTRDQTESYFEAEQMVGLKPYHVYSTSEPTFEAPLESFLPTWAWELADERGLVIVLHMVRPAALADPDNQREIREKCERYPGAQLLLAHAARGFHAPNTVKGISSLRGLENVWFDSSGICEPQALEAVLREFGPRRLCWGSDFPVSEMRGKCVTVGNGFLWLDLLSVDWESLSPPCQAMLVGLESLAALLQAADAWGLNESDREDLFAGNAERLLGLQAPTQNTGQDLYRHAKTLLPGGTQLLSKRPEMILPDLWPAYYREARGCEVWDLDGNHYYDITSNAVGACLLGYADPDVSAAVMRRINLGSMAMLNCPEEVDLAEALCAIHPWAEQVRYARSGGETTSVAVRIARATTDRSLVAVCGYHGWHDWYLAANLGENDDLRGHLLPGLDPLGVPRELRGTIATFEYDNLAQFQELVATRGDELAAVIMEPARYHDPAPGFLEGVREAAHSVGALLIFDEISIGWRFVHGGAHLAFGVNPDLAVFSKALGNGHPIGAVLGTTAAMSGAHDSFISSTYWTEGVGFAAALATLRKLGQMNAPAHVFRLGTRVQNLWRELGARHELPLEVDDGYPCFAHFAFTGEHANELRTLFAQEMLQRGFLAAVSFYPTMAHTPAVVDLYAEAVEETFAQLAEALASGDVAARLRGPVAHAGFRRLTT
jgi:glutamate-1-semialdehyde 2,1-aminomutase